MRRVLTIPALLILLAAGCETTPEVPRDTNPVRVITLAPGMIEEVCLDLAEDDLLHYTYRASGTIDFNIHYHEGERVAFPVERPNTRHVSGSFIAEAPQTYCLMWTNNGSEPVEVRFETELVRQRRAIQPPRGWRAAE